MDQKKTGSFLKTLRKEKGLTQSQLAEHFNVSDRTVSRWESGSNLPDLSLLVELADFYNVDIKEIICGERKSENMDVQEKETLKMVADYAENEKRNQFKRVLIVDIIGIVSMLLAFIIGEVKLNLSVGFWGAVVQCLCGFALGVIITNLLYTTGILARMGATSKKRMIWRIFGVVCAVYVVLNMVRSFFI